MEHASFSCVCGWRKLPVFAFVTLPAALVAQTPAGAPPLDLVLKNATVMTVTHGTMQHASVWVHDGKIAGYGQVIAAPATALIVDATGKFVTPGIIDASLTSRVKQ